MFALLKKNKKIISVSAIILFLLSVSAGAVFLLDKSKVSHSPQLMDTKDPNYNTVESVKGDIIKIDNGAGTIVPVTKYDLCFESPYGNIKRLYAKSGEAVKAGELLAELDYMDMQEQIKELEIDLEISKLDYQKLASSNASQYELKKANLLIESIELDLEYLKKEFGKKKIVSPVNGIVTYRISSKIGSEVSSSDIIYTISDIRDIEIQYYGKYIWDLPIGKKVSINYKNKDYSGIVISGPMLRKVGNSLVEKYYYVNIKFDNMPKDFRIGDNANIRIEVERKENVIKIPKSAVTKLNDQSIVTVLENGNKITKQVETGLSGEVDVEITKGLNEGERVILN